MGQTDIAPTTPVLPVSTPAQKTKNDARATIEKLVNHNPVPRLVGSAGEARPIFDVTYDWAEYHRVWEAVRELAPKAEALWPELVKHLDDDRYCLTAWTFSEYPLNLTVGEMCRKLISDCLSQGYFQHLRPNSLVIHGRMYTPSIARDTKTLEAWCVARSDKPLYELQVEMCGWAIKTLKRSADWPEVPDSRRRAWIAAIEAEIVSLTKSKRAVPSDWFRGEAYTRFLRSRRSISESNILIATRSVKRRGLLAPKRNSRTA